MRSIKDEFTLISDHQDGLQDMYLNLEVLRLPFQTLIQTNRLKGNLPPDDSNPESMGLLSKCLSQRQPPLHLWQS